MTDILNQIGSAFGGLVDSSAVQVTARLLFLYLVLVWVATAWWAFRDLSRRTTSLPGPFLVSGLFVLATPLFFVPVAIVYRVVRPAETLAEASERDLTETALEATPTHAACPSCGSPIEDGLAALPVVPLRAARAVPAVHPAGRGRVAGLPVVRRRAAVAARPGARDDRSARGPDGLARLGATTTTADASATAEDPSADETDAPEPATTGSSGRSSTAIW